MSGTPRTMRSLRSAVTITRDRAFVGRPRSWPEYRRQVRRMVSAAARSEGVAISLSVHLTSDDAICALNTHYRRKRKPTDVLAFSQREGEGGDPASPELGDVIISMETAARQAKGSLHNELLFLTAHGLCHLLGYDHRTDREEAEMNARMKALLAQARGRGRVVAA